MNDDEQITFKIKQEYLEKKDDETPLFFYTMIISISFLIFIILFFMMHTPTLEANILDTNDIIVRPSIDLRTYRVIRLPNELEVLLISDKKTNTCGAAMVAGTGSFYDAGTSGLAHFFEHMIFLGSKSYPAPSQFEKLLTEHFGSTNAFTKEEETVFYFDIGTKGFELALTMFSKMFAEPLLDINLMTKEIHAVNSENNKNLNNDNWRENQVIKTLSNKASTYNSFSTGNIDTLGGVEKNLLHLKITEFFDKYYRPHNMKLVVEANYSLDTLQDFVMKLFGEIKINESRVKPDYLKPVEKPYSTYDLGKIVWFQKLSSTISLDFIFVMNEIYNDYKTKPYNYASYLINYDGEKSLIGYLKSKKWVVSMESGLMAAFKKFSEFAITLNLTDEGYKNIDKIIALVFKFLDMIRNQGVKREIFDEISKIFDSKFRFMEKESRYGRYLANLATNMMEYEHKDVIYGDYVLNEFNSTVIQKYLDSLTIGNSLIILGNKYYPDERIKKLFFDKSMNLTEKWYGTTYTSAKIDDNSVNYNKIPEFSGEIFRIRPSNNFITTQSNITNCDKNDCFTSKTLIKPSLHLDSENLKIWYKTDHTFSVPKVIFYVNYEFRNARTTTFDFSIIRVFFNYIKLIIDDELFEATETGNKINVLLTSSGINVVVSCYSDLVVKIFTKLNSIIYRKEFNLKTFNEVIEITSNSIKQTVDRMPYIKAFMYFNKVINYHYSLPEEGLDILKTLKFNDFVLKINEFHKEILCTSLFYGDISVQTVDLIKDHFALYIPINNKMKLKNPDDFSIKIHDLQSSYIYRVKNTLPTEPNHVIVNYYQIGVRDYKKSLIIDLIELFWGNIFYENLRTKKQLGYVVSASKYFVNNVMYIRIIIQGNKETPEKMNREIEGVIGMIKNDLQNFNQKLLEQYKATIERLLFKPEDNLSVRSDFVWHEISEKSYYFDRKFKLDEELKKITLNDVIEEFNRVFYNEVKMLSVQIYAGKSNFTVEHNNLEENYGLNQSVKSRIVNNLDFANALPLLKFTQSEFSRIKEGN